MSFLVLKIWEEFRKRHKMKQARPIKSIKSWKPTSKLMLTGIWAILVNLFFKILLNLSDLLLTRLKVGQKKHVILSAHDTKLFIMLLERAFKMIKNGVYFIVITLLVAELFQPRSQGLSSLPPSAQDNFV